MYKIKRIPKKYMIIFIVIFIVFITILSYVFIDNFVNRININNFNNIDDFNTINNLIVENLEPINDKNVKDCNYIKSYNVKIKYENKIYIINAYEMKSLEDSRNYFKNETGKITERENNFSKSSNMIFSTELISYNKNYIYMIKGNDYFSFKNFLIYLNDTVFLQKEPIR